MEQICLNCDSPLKGRVDKKFCDDQCRSSYNNKFRNEGNDSIKSINRILKRNRSILKKLNPGGKIKLSKTRLTAGSFNFDHFTHIYRTASGSSYIFCYEYGYLILPGDEVLLVKKELKI